MAQRAIELGHRVQDDALCAEDGFSLGLAYMNNLEVRLAQESWQIALNHARQADDFVFQTLSLLRIPLSLILLGDLGKAETVALEGLELTSTTQDWGEHSQALSHLTTVSVARGRFHLTEQYARETMLMVDRSRYPWGGVKTLLALACARAVRGAHAESEEALDMLTEPNSVFASLGSLVKRVTKAFRFLPALYNGASLDIDTESIVEDILEVVSSDSYSLAPLCAVIKIMVFTSCPTLLNAPYQRLCHFSEQGVKFSSGGSI